MSFLARTRAGANQTPTTVAASPIPSPDPSPIPSKPVADPVHAKNDGMFTAEGLVRNFSQRQASVQDGDLFEKIRRRLRSPDYPDLRITIWDFVVEPHDRGGRRLPPIPVQMWHEEGKIAGLIKDGQEVALFDPIEPGAIVRPSRIYNVTTNTLVETRA